MINNTSKYVVIVSTKIKSYKWTIIFLKAFFSKKLKLFCWFRIIQTRNALKVNHGTQNSSKGW